MKRSLQALHEPRFSPNSLISAFVGLLVLAGTQLASAQSTGDFRSAANGNWGDIGTWQTYNGTIWVAASTTPTTVGVTTLQSPYVVTVATSVAVDQVVVSAGAQVVVSSGITLTINNGVSVDMAVYGTMQNSGIVTGPGNLVFESTGQYTHNQNGGAIPTATWGSNSVCLITGLTTATNIGGLGQAFYHFSWYCPSGSGYNPSARFDALGALTNIRGNFSVTAVIQTARLLSFSSSHPAAASHEFAFSLAPSQPLRIGGNLNMTNVAISFAGSSSAQGNNAQVFLGGNVNLSGTNTCIYSSYTGSGRVAYGFIAYTNAVTGTQLTFDPSADAIFDSSAAYTYLVLPGVTLDLTNANCAVWNFTNYPGSTLKLACNANTVANIGAIEALDDDGSLQAASQTDENGNFPPQETNYFEPNATYVYYGTYAQNTGSGLPSVVANLTINNAAGVTVQTVNEDTPPLTAAVLKAVTNMLSVVSGTLNLSSTNAPGVTVVGGLSGFGSITNGSVTISNTGVGLLPGASGVAGTLTLDGTLTFGSSAKSTFDLSGSTSSGNDQVVLIGGGTVAGSGSTITINPLAPLAAGDYVLFNVTGSGSVASGFNATPAWLGTPPANAGDYSITTSGKQVILHYQNVGGVVSHYLVSAAPTQTTGAPFALTVTAKDITGATVVTNLALTMSSTGSGQFDGNGNSVYGEAGDNTKTLSSGTFSINAKDSTAETITITATDAYGNNGSTNITITAGALDHFTVVASSPHVVGTPFAVTVTAQDSAGNTLTANNSTAVTLTSSLSGLKFDANGNGTFGETGDNIETLSAGAFAINAEDNTPETGTITATGGGKTGVSASFTIAYPNIYVSKQSGTWSNTNTWLVSSNNGATYVPATQTPTIGSVTLQSPYVVTDDISVTVNQVIVNAGAQLLVNSGITFAVTNGATTDLAVYGTVQNSGVILAGGTIVFEPGGQYFHSEDGGNIPASVWSTNSTCTITGFVNTAPSGLNQVFYNFSHNSIHQTNYFNARGNLTNIQGNFTIVSGYAGNYGNKQYHGFDLNLLPGQVATIKGDLSLTNGYFIIADFSANLTLGAYPQLNIGGNLYQGYYGYFGSANSSVKTNANAIICLLPGNHTIISTTNWFYTGYINSQIMDRTELYCWLLGTNATFDMGTNYLGPWSFTNYPGSTLKLGDPNGIETAADYGNLQPQDEETTAWPVIGYNYFESNASYVYEGTESQFTGSGLPNPVANLTINNPTGVALGAFFLPPGYVTLTEVTNMLAITSGGLDLSGNSVATVEVGGLEGFGAITNGSLTLEDDGPGLLPGSAGVAGTLTLDGTLTFGSSSKATFDLSGSTSSGNDQVVFINGGSVAGSGSTITINPLAPLAAGDYVLFNITGSGSVISGFNTNPAWAGTPPSNARDYTIVTSGNQVLLHYTFVPQPIFVAPFLSGSNLVVSGSGGTPHAPYRLLSSTNIALPLVRWTPILTNSFSATGTFSNNIATSLSATPRFYVVVSP